MRAAQINEYGNKDVVQLNGDAIRPQPKASQVLVEVCAAGVNPFDYKVREGWMKDFVQLDFPATLGGDVAGYVAEIGEDVTGFARGDEVYGQANALSGVGSYSEFTPVEARSLAVKPKSIDMVKAAALPLAGISAYQGLVDHINLQRGQRILIHGGAGGIGSYAIQLAKHLGAFVYTTATAEDHEYVKQLGANEVIDYKSQQFFTVLNDIDAVFDTIGGDTYKKSYEVIKRGGVLVSMVEAPEETLTKNHGITAIHQSTKVITERLNKLAELVDGGALEVQVSKVFPLEEASEALAYIQEGKQQGKVVLKIK